MLPNLPPLFSNMKWLRKLRRRQKEAGMCVTLLLVAITIYVINISHVSKVVGRGMVPLDDTLFDQGVRKPLQSRRTDDVQSLIKFQPLIYNPHLENLTFDNVGLYPCSQPDGPGPDGIVDLMCVPRPNYLPTFKNPCFRDSSQFLKCMPYYNILGFDKCGTTDLSARLTSHPAIKKCTAYMGKEIYYWGWLRLGLFQHEDRKVRTLDDYTLNFRLFAANLSAVEGHSNQPVVGDGGPIDSWDFRGWTRDPQNKGLSEPKVLTPHHLRHMLKDPRFIILMRNPTERLYSDYYFTGAGNSPESFARDVEHAINMINACLKVNDTRLCFFSQYLYENMPTRLHIGCYSIFLREWLSVFHRKHFLFIRTEDYNKDMIGTLETAFKFLGVETLSHSIMENIINETRKFQTKIKTMAGPMFDKTRKMLDDFYAPCNANLRELLGEDKYLWQEVSHHDSDRNIMT